MTIDILSGQVQSGKTTLLQRITLELKRKDIGVGGFLNSKKLSSRLKKIDKIFDVADEDVHPQIIALLEQEFVR